MGCGERTNNLLIIKVLDARTEHSNIISDLDYDVDRNARRCGVVRPTQVPIPNCGRIGSERGLSALVGGSVLQHLSGGFIPTKSGHEGNVALSDEDLVLGVSLLESVVVDLDGASPRVIVEPSSADGEDCVFSVGRPDIILRVKLHRNPASHDFVGFKLGCEISIARRLSTSEGEIWIEDTVPSKSCRSIARRSGDKLVLVAEGDFVSAGVGERVFPERGSSVSVSSSICSSSASESSSSKSQSSPLKGSISSASVGISSLAGERHLLILTSEKTG